MRSAVLLPKGEDLNEWLAVNSKLHAPSALFLKVNSNTSHELAFPFVFPSYSCGFL